MGSHNPAMFQITNQYVPLTSVQHHSPTRSPLIIIHPGAALAQNAAARPLRRVAAVPASIRNGDTLSASFDQWDLPRQQSLWKIIEGIVTVGIIFTLSSSFTFLLGCQVKIETRLPSWKDLESIVTTASKSLRRCPLNATPMHDAGLLAHVWKVWTKSLRCHLGDKRSLKP